MNLQNNNKSFLGLIFCCFLLIQTVFSQFKIPEKPKFQTSVYDYANILSGNEKIQLEEKLVRYSDSTSTQIVVISIESLNGEDIGILTPKWGQTWGIGGSQQNDNGVIILLAKAERKIWISAGYGLEDRLSAGIGGEIIRNIIIPEFKKGSYYNGLDKGSDAIFKVFIGKYKGTRKQNNTGIPLGKIIFYGILILIFLYIISRGNKNNGNSNSNGGGGFGTLLDAIILSNLGRSGGGFGGSSGGGFGGGGFGGGFGGGGFSGGGSGGSW